MLQLALNSRHYAAPLRRDDREQEGEEHEERPANPARLVENRDRLPAAEYKVRSSSTERCQPPALAGLEEDNRGEDHPINDDQR